MGLQSPCWPVRTWRWGLPFLLPFNPFDHSLESQFVAKMSLTPF